MENSVIEKTLKLKIASLESAVARIADSKNQLKRNADAAKKDVSDAFCRQQALLRYREQQLLTTVDTVAAMKAEALGVQQDQLHQALGTCYQSEQFLNDYLSHSAYPAGDNDVIINNIQDMINRLATLPLTPCERPYIGFESDDNAVRRTLDSFGRISSIPVIGGIQQMTQLSNETNSIPLDFGDCRDNLVDSQVIMPQKSFTKPTNNSCTSPLHVRQLGAAGNATTLRQAVCDDRAKLGKTTAVSAMSTVGTTHLHHWLKQIKDPNETELPFHDDYLLAKDHFSCNESVGDNSEFASSAELMTNLSMDSKVDNLFSDYFTKMRKSPMDDWIQQRARTDSNVASLCTTKCDDFERLSAPADDAGTIGDNNVADGLLSPYLMPVLTPKKDSRATASCVAWNGQQPVGSVVAATDRRPAQSQPFADMPVNFLARYERYIKTLDRKMWLVGDEKMDISTYVAPTVQMDEHQRSIESARETLKQAGYLKCFTPTPQQTQIDCGDDDNNSSSEHIGCQPIISDLSDQSLWLTPASQDLLKGQASNAYPADMCSYERVLGWEAILERIHTSGEENWLLRQ